LDLFLQLVFYVLSRKYTIKPILFKHLFLITLPIPTDFAQALYSKKWIAKLRYLLVQYGFIQNKVVCKCGKDKKLLGGTPNKERRILESI
jgi:hypothetical protein